MLMEEMQMAVEVVVEDIHQIQDPDPEWKSIMGNRNYLRSVCSTRTTSLLF